MVSMFFLVFYDQSKKGKKQPFFRSLGIVMFQKRKAVEFWRKDIQQKCVLFSLRFTT